MTPQRPAFSATWREGRFFDLWMLAHFASGAAGGFSNVFFGLSTLGVYVLGTLIMTFWEAAEYVLGVRESWSNRVLDVVIGLLGVQVALWIVAALAARWHLVAFVAGLGLALALNAIGWVAFRRRARASSK